MSSGDIFVGCEKQPYSKTLTHTLQRRAPDAHMQHLLDAVVFQCKHSSIAVVAMHCL